MSVKAIGIAIKLTLEGANQLVYFQTWIFVMVAITCIITQLNYLNMVSITLTDTTFGIWNKKLEPSFVFLLEGMLCSYVLAFYFVSSACIYYEESFCL